MLQGGEVLDVMCFTGYRPRVASIFSRTVAFIPGFDQGVSPWGILTQNVRMRKERVWTTQRPWT